jgi:hypothetical protein
MESVPDGKRGIPEPLWRPSGSFPILRFAHFCSCRGQSNAIGKVIRYYIYPHRPAEAKPCDKTRRLELNELAFYSLIQIVPRIRQNESKRARFLDPNSEPRDWRPSDELIKISTVLSKANCLTITLLFLMYKNSCSGLKIPDPHPV